MKKHKSVFVNIDKTGMVCIILNRRVLSRVTEGREPYDRTEDGGGSGAVVHRHARAQSGASSDERS